MSGNSIQDRLTPTINAEWLKFDQLFRSRAESGYVSLRQCFEVAYRQGRKDAIGELQQRVSDLRAGAFNKGNRK